MLIIDAHMHLWDTLQGTVNGKPVTALEGGRSMFGDELRQMMPPYMIDGKNTVEMFLSNMDFARVAGAVVTQEYIDGNQNDYLLESQEKYPERLKICELYVEGETPSLAGFDGLKVPAQRLEDPDITKLMPMFQEMEKKDIFLSIDLADGDQQTGYMREIISHCPDLRIAIGHFGMPTRKNWQEQIKLARNKNVYIESGGITWLFHPEFYPYPSAAFAIKEAGNLCGMDKLMWGSDYPRTMSVITYQMSYDFILQSVWLTQEEKLDFLGRTAKEFYGFENLAVPPAITTMVD